MTLNIFQPDLKLFDSSGDQTFPEFVEVDQDQVVVQDLDPVDQETRLVADYDR